MSQEIRYLRQNCRGTRCIRPRREKKEQFIVISALKTDVPTILWGLSEENDSTTALKAIIITELCNSHDGVIRFYPRASEYLGDQRINLQVGIKRDLGTHMEAKLFAIKLFGKYGVLWLHLAADIEAFQMHLVTTTYVEGEVSTWRAEFWTVVLPWSG